MAIISNMEHTEDIIREYETLYYCKMKTGTNADKFVLLKSFKSVAQNNEVETQEVTFYSERNARTLNVGTTKAFVSDGYLTREEIAQEFIDIADFNKISDMETEYEIIKVMLYKTTDTPNVYVAHHYMTNIIVTHIAPDGRLAQYNVSFNVKGDMKEVGFNTETKEIIES